MTWLMQCAVCSVHPRSRQKDVISQPHSSSLIATCSNAHACTPFCNTLELCFEDLHAFHVWFAQRMRAAPSVYVIAHVIVCSKVHMCIA